MATRKTRHRTTGCVRSDARTLHVDFENFADTLIIARNAGIIVDWGTRARIINGFGFDGKRCLHIAAHGPDQMARTKLVCAYDAPPACQNVVLEFVYRPALDKTLSLKKWPISRCLTPGGAPGAYELKYINDPVYGMEGAPVLDQAAKDAPRLTALELYATGSKASGTYRVDLTDRDGTQVGVIDGLNQLDWTRFIMHRHDDMVDLFVGPPDNEQFIGSYPDIMPGGEIYCVFIGNSHDPNARGSGYWDSFRLGRVLGASGKVAPPEPKIKHVGLDVPTPPACLTLGREKHLLIDDWSITETRNVHRIFHRPVKHRNNPLIVADKPWEPLALFLAGGVERQTSGSYRMWYCSADPQPGNRKNIHTCLATSDDGIKWRKPALDLNQYKDAKRTNIVIKGAGISWVFGNPDEPRRDFRYLAKIRHHGTQGWTSADGLHWTNQGVIITQGADATTCQWDPVRRKYIASLKFGYKGRRFRGYAESDDFLNWTDTYLMADVDHLDIEGDHIYQMPMFRYESLYLGMCKIYHIGTSDTCDIQLAVSHNCLHWERPYRAIDVPKFVTRATRGEEKIIEYIQYDDPHTQPFIPSGPLGSWDYGNNDCPATAPVRHGDELLFYYSGRYQSHSARSPVKKDWKGAYSNIGLATLRLDGFVSAQADAQGGYVLTKPLRLKGDNLFVNTNAAGGKLRVEVLDQRAKPIKGFGLDQARTIRSDKVKAKCSWKNRNGIASLAGKIVRLKFHLADAALYAFWCQ